MHVWSLGGKPSTNTFNGAEGTQVPSWYLAAILSRMLAAILPGYLAAVGNAGAEIGRWLCRVPGVAG